MKRLFILLFLLPAISYGQFGGGKLFSFGLKVGANFSQLNTLEMKTPRLTSGGMPVMSGGQVVYDFFRNNDSRTTGIVGGAFFRFGRKLYIQPELLVSSKGGKFDLIQTGLVNQSVDVKFTTFDVPVLIGFKLGPLRLNAGPLMSLTISEDKNLKDSFKQYTTQPIDETFKQAVFGYQAGVGLSLGGLQLDLRYEGNLSDLSQVGIKTANTDARFNTKSTLWQLTLGYAIL
ncbi:outer membrane beta-barrel protein [Larkinella terrae]|uniref:Outer membrane beta-barrel protein n=1 Tax=Larkinella terrae TaxID=2025311 RepID=A0A7K0EIE5_9BACT|nr:outer membrane beta-barrel protein [Larkinella terrae]MRS61609.1 outer membrane beta-barrel protein [Larkinella terrae]